MPFALRHVSGSGWVRDLVGRDPIVTADGGGAAVADGAGGGRVGSSAWSGAGVVVVGNAPVWDRRQVEAWLGRG